MKSWQIIGVVFIFLIFIGAVFFLNRNRAGMSYDVRIAFTTKDLLMHSLDPAKISSFYQSSLLENIYSRLVEYDEDGNLQSGIASKFYWENDFLIFEFDKKVQTKSGHFIGAEDAAVSIRRALKIGLSTHTNLKYFLCDLKSTLDVFSNCESIFTKNGNLYLKIISSKFRQFVVTTLAAGDFAIIPMQSLNERTLEIVDFENTSGPYYVERFHGSWVLKKNRLHYQNTKESPNKVILVSPVEKSAAELFLEDKVDVIPTAYNVPELKFKEIKESVPDLMTSATLPIKLFLIKFSLPCLRRTSIKQRFYIASEFRKIMARAYPLPIFADSTNEFFLNNGYGQLSKPQLEELKVKLDVKVPEEIKEPISFYLYRDLKEVLSVFKEISELDMVETDKYPFNQNLEDRLDLSLITTDTGYEEDLSLIKYNFNQGTFGISNSDADQWLESYLNEEDKIVRGSMLQELQFQALNSGVIFPLYKAPYIALTRNGFNINLSPIYASTRFWKIRKND